MKGSVRIPDGMVSMTTSDFKHSDSKDKGNNNTELWLVQVPCGFHMSALNGKLDPSVFSASASRTIKVKDEQSVNRYLIVSSHISGAEEQPEKREKVPFDCEAFQQRYESYLAGWFEGLALKSAPQRKVCLDGLISLLCKRYVAEFLDKRKETATDGLLKCLKRGKADEQILAARCLNIVALQLEVDMCDLYDDVQAVITPLLNDNSTSVLVRAEELKSKMLVMENIFKKSVSSKADSSEQQSSPNMSQLYTNCLIGWCLLLTRTPDFFIQSMAESHISMLGQLLLSPHTDLRIAAGEAIALLYDLNRCIDEDFGFGEDNFETEFFCEQLKDLSTESTKHISKNALRQQRARFRDILQTVKENMKLRDIFGMGPPPPIGMKPPSKTQMTKVQRRYYNN